MADMDLNVNVDTTQAQRNVTALENRVNKLNQRFGELRSAIAGIAVIALARSAMQLADSIQDVSDATGIARTNVLAFGQAVLESGGSMESATNGLNNFVKSINDAATGSKTTREAFSDLGISLKDIQTLSERALLAKTLKGLEQVEDKAKAAAIGTELFGKAFKGVAGQNVGSLYTQAVVEAERYNSSIKAVSDLQGKLDRTFVNLQLSILKALEPLANFLNNIPQDKLDKMIEGFIQLGAAAVSIAATAKTLQMLGTAVAFVGAAFASFQIGLALVAKGVTGVGVATQVANAGYYSLGKTIGITLKVLKDYSVPALLAATTLSGKLAELGKTGAMLAKRFGYFAGSMSLVATAGKLTAASLGAIVAGFVRMIPFIGTVIAGLLALNEVLKATTNISLAGWFDEGAAAMERFVTDKFPKIAAALNWLGDKMGMAPSPMEQKAADPRAALRKQEIGDYEKINSLLDVRQQEEEKAAKDRKTKSDASYVALQQFGLEQRQQVANYQESLRLTQQRLGFENNLVIKNGELVRISEDDKDILRAQNDLLMGQVGLINNIQNEIEKIKLNEKLGLDDQAAAKIKILNENIRQIQGATADASNSIVKYLTTAQTARILEEDRLRTLENITKAYDDQVSRTQTLGDQIRTVGQQLNDAMFEGTQIGKSPIEAQIAKIKRDAEVAAQSARQAFAGMFGDGDLGPEREAELLKGLDAISVKYQQLAVLQADNVRANYDYSRSWSGGWEEAFRQYIENATNAANTARDVFGAVTTNMNSAIDNFVETGKFKFGDFAQSIIRDLVKIELKALASKVLSPILSGLGSGISSILGFAEGGNPPINRPSLVGEKGPELFVPKTAGTVVPNNALGGGAPITNNYITNNISAVDAKSVAQLFAENRRTLFGTMKLAEKELSYR
jgi:lambda family phage tail tape measure protein